MIYTIADKLGRTNKGITKLIPFFLLVDIYKKMCNNLTNIIRL